MPYHCEERNDEAISTWDRAVVASSFSKNTLVLIASAAIMT
jgi:hypothetical protein